MAELVSVIVPVFKVEKYLNRCVESIVNQTYKDLEILLIDDGSPDNCPQLCDEWAKKDSRIEVIHQKNAGLSSARNTGINHAKGEYLVFVDSDDYISAKMIDTLYKVLQESQSDLAICDFEKGEEDNYIFSENDGEQVCYLSSIEALKAIYDSAQNAQLYVAAWGKLYKSRLFQDINFPDGKIFEDIYVTHQILYRCNQIAFVPQKLVYYFQHADSIMSAPFHIGKLDYLEALNERIAFFKEHQLNDLESIAYDEYLHALIWEYSRARDILGNREAMKDIKSRFRTAYRKGYASSRYPNETARFLAVFNFNPELIVAYWKLDGKRKSLFNRG